jgi:hypothetical protein
MADPEGPYWYGWARLFGTWRRITGPYPGIDVAARALEAELRRRGLRVRSMDQCMVLGPQPPRGRDPIPEAR